MTRDYEKDLHTYVRRVMRLDEQIARSTLDGLQVNSSRWHKLYRRRATAYGKCWRSFILATQAAATANHNSSSPIRINPQTQAPYPPPTTFKQHAAAFDQAARSARLSGRLQVEHRLREAGLEHPGLLIDVHECVQKQYELLLASRLRVRTPVQG